MPSPTSRSWPSRSWRRLPWPAWSPPPSPRWRSPSFRSSPPLGYLPVHSRAISRPSSYRRSPASRWARCSPHTSRTIGCGWGSTPWPSSTLVWSPSTSSRARTPFSARPPQPAACLACRRFTSGRRRWASVICSSPRRRVPCSLVAPVPRWPRRSSPPPLGSASISSFWSSMNCRPLFPLRWRWPRSRCATAVARGRLVWLRRLVGWGHADLQRGLTVRVRSRASGTIDEHAVTELSVAASVAYDEALRVGQGSVPARSRASSHRPPCPTATRR